VVRRGSDGRVEDATAPPSNVRSRVHEYGGGAFAAASGILVISDDTDRRLYRASAGEPPRPLVPAGERRYADLEIDRARGRAIAVCEDHGAGGHEPRASIVAVPLSPAGGQPRPPEELVAGADFYSSPRQSPDGRHLAYLAWSHPLMPWDGTELFVAPLDARGRPGLAVKIAGGPEESVLEPRWAPDGSLAFVSDRGGYWQLHRWRPGHAVAALAARRADFAAPPWVFGLASYGFLDADRIVCAFQEEGLWRLGVLDTARGVLDEVPGAPTEISYVRAAGGRAVFVGASPASPPAVYELDPASMRLGVLYRVPAPAFDPYDLSRPEPIAFPTTDGARAHGLFYPPSGRGRAGPPGERPPLIVMSHGGPTSAASSACNLALQFWTTRGFAVLDVNYRGSTGFGRAYRSALAGMWGVRDVDDCVSGARHLGARGAVDPNRIVIRGGSAGGYTTLAALAFRDAFRAGASYYGVSDLEALARDTHKFESRYLDRLIGPYPARRDLYLERSPLAHADRLRCPVIFFQGLEDRVVPPDQAERMASALRARGVEVEYVTFPDEQHGFRKAENVARALEAELAFYRRVLGIPRPEQETA
jgi:dipeptidyl aminopeptidase/acylaminoacyl peptidase